MTLGVYKKQCGEANGVKADTHQKSLHRMTGKLSESWADMEQTPENCGALYHDAHLRWPA